MSYWSYAKIEFRIDGNQSVTDVENLIGHIYSWEDMMYDHENNINRNINKDFYLPMGSEGSLDIYIKSCNANRTIVKVCGGLRDRYDIDDIIEWYNEIIKKNESREFDVPVIKSIKGCAYDDSGDEKYFEYKYHYTKEEKIRLLKWYVYMVTHFWYWI